MNIVVTLNAHYIRPLCVMLRSLLDAHPNRSVDVFVIHSSLEPAHFSFVEDTLRCVCTAYLCPRIFSPTHR